MRTYKVTVDEANTIRWYNKADELHRVDGPAIEYTGGTEMWFLNGRYHREGGPAIRYSSGAIRHSGGAELWFLNGRYHREDGPAIEYLDGTKMWFLNGKYHRLDGPAIEYTYGRKEWFLNGNRFTEKEFLLKISKPDCTKQTITIEGKDYILVLK